MMSALGGDVHPWGRARGTTASDAEIRAWYGSPNGDLMCESCQHFYWMTALSSSDVEECHAADRGEMARFEAAGWCLLHEQPTGDLDACAGLEPDLDERVQGVLHGTRESVAIFNRLVLEEMRHHLTRPELYLAPVGIWPTRAERERRDAAGEPRYTAEERREVLSWLDSLPPIMHWDRDRKGRWSVYQIDIEPYVCPPTPHLAVSPERTIRAALPEILSGLEHDGRPIAQDFAQRVLEAWLARLRADGRVRTAFSIHVDRLRARRRRVNREGARNVPITAAPHAEIWRRLRDVCRHAPFFERVVPTGNASFRVYVDGDGLCAVTLRVLGPSDESEQVLGIVQLPKGLRLPGKELSPMAERITEDCDWIEEHWPDGRIGHVFPASRRPMLRDLIAEMTRSLASSCLPGVSPE